MDRTALQAEIETILDEYFAMKKSTAEQQQCAEK